MAQLPRPRWLNMGWPLTSARRDSGVSKGDILSARWPRSTTALFLAIGVRSGVVDAYISVLGQRRCAASPRHTTRRRFGMRHAEELTADTRVAPVRRFRIDFRRFSRLAFVALLLTIGTASVPALAAA